MIIIGHEAIKYPNFRYIESIDEIVNSQANDIVWFFHSKDTNYDIAKHCNDNDIAYAVIVESLKDTLIYANLGAKYICTKERNLAENAQRAADEYFFDSKILYIINDCGSIETMANLGIDGVIFNNILKTNSLQS